jgi:hypothetical protein
MPPRTLWAVRPTLASRRYRQYRLSSGIERPLGRVVAVVLLVVVLLALALANAVARLGPSEQARRLGQLNPQQLLEDPHQHFLPTPIVVLQAELPAAPLPPPTEAPVGAGVAAANQVKVVDTGGLGVLLRSEPPAGRLVATLRDGQVLDVLEQRMVNEAEWLRVRTRDGVEGWVFGRLVAPAP